MPEQPADSACDLLRRYADGTTNPVAAVEACLARIDALNGPLNALCHVDPRSALDAAMASAQRWRHGQPCGPLDGVPATIKDFFDVRGWPTRRGSRLLADAAPAAADAPAVGLLRDAGAILLGKTTTTEFGHKASGVSPLTGVTRNPLNPAWTSGGSSCGAAVAAATGMAPLNLGSDAAGSIRIPAAFCGIYGHKPSGGLVPAFPPSAFGHAAVLGPMTRTVADARLMLRVIARPDHWQPAAVDAPNHPAAGARDLRLVVATGVNDCRAQGEALDVFEGAVERLQAAGAEVIRRDVRIEHLLPRFLTLWHVFVATAARQMSEVDLARIEPTLAAMVRAGRTIDAVAFNAATMFFAEATLALRDLIGDADALVLPTLPFGPFAASAEHPGEPPRDGWLAWAETCFLFNATLMPASSVPCGTLADGRPLAVQIVGPRWSDDRIMAIAETLSRLLRAPAG